MRSNHPLHRMPVPGLDPGIVTGIRVFRQAFSKQDVDGQDNPPIKPGDGHDSGKVIHCDRNTLWK